MRLLPLIIAAALIAASPASVFAKAPFETPQHILAWIDNYRLSPEPARVPEAVHRIRALGLLDESDNTGLFVGFVAGVLARNPDKASALVKQMFPMPPKDQTIIIKGIAYSGLPDWKGLLAAYAERMPTRDKLIDAYLHKGEKTMYELPLDNEHFVIDTLWGYHYATDDYAPVARIIDALEWVDEGDDLKKLTAAMKAKWTLAANAERDHALVKFYGEERQRRKKPVKSALKGVIKAAEAYEADGLRKQLAALIDERKAKGPESRTVIGRARELGATAISFGCIVAGATGHAEIAVPCVISGALYTGAFKVWENLR